MKLIANLITEQGIEKITLDEGTNIFWLGDGKKTLTSDELFHFLLQGKLTWVDPPEEVGEKPKEYVFDIVSFLLGNNCPRALHLDYYHAHLAKEGNDYIQLLGADGLKVRELAYQYYGGGKYIYGGNYKKSIEDTFAAYSSGEPIIYGGRVERQDGYIYSARLPILISKDNGYKLISTTTSTKVKEDHINKIGFMGWLAYEAGLIITGYEILNPNKDYVHDGISFSLKDYFSCNDITEQVNDVIPQIDSIINHFDDIISGEEPTKNLGSTCSKCKYKDACFEGLPEHNIFTLPRITQSKKALYNLKINNIYDIKDIPETIELSKNQERRKACVIKNEIIHTSDAKEQLLDLKQPIHFIDFETLPMPIPKYKGMKVHQHLLFQWSNHILIDDKLTHEEYLDTTGTDCRLDFLKTLLKSCKDAGTIVVYSSFEASRMKELKEFYPGYSDEIDKMMDKFFDLERYIANNIDHPKFYGRTSIKVVLPALYPNNPYESLTVHNGTGAITAYSKMIQDGTPEKEKKQIERDLLDYCGLDTEAMVIVYRELLKILK